MYPYPEAIKMMDWQPKVSDQTYDNSSKFTVTVILPFHKNDELLYEAIESVLNSVNCSIHLIAVDTRLKSKALDSKILKLPNIEVISAPGTEYIEALSIGLQSTRTEYITLMNSDDLISPYKFYKQITLLNNSKSDLCITNLRKFSSVPENPLPSLGGEYKSATYFIELLLFGSYGADATWLFRKKWADKVNLFRESSDKSDWETALRIFPVSKICKIDEDLYFYRMHKGQLTRKKSGKNLKRITHQLSEYNSQMGLPSLDAKTIEVIAGISRPQFTAYFEKFPENNIDVWFQKLIMNSGLNGREINQVIKIFGRRKLLLSFTNIRYLKYFDVKIFSELIREICILKNRLRW